MQLITVRWSKTDKSTALTPGLIKISIPNISNGKESSDTPSRRLGSSTTRKPLGSKKLNGSLVSKTSSKSLASETPRKPNPFLPIEVDKTFDRLNSVITQYINTTLIGKDIYNLDPYSLFIYSFLEEKKDNIADIEKCLLK